MVSHNAILIIHQNVMHHSLYNVISFGKQLSMVHDIEGATMLRVALMSMLGLGFSDQMHG